MPEDKKLEARETKGDVEDLALDSDDDKVREGEKDPSVTQTAQVQEKKSEEDKPNWKQVSSGPAYADEQLEPARNDPSGMGAEVLDRDQSLGFEPMKMPDAPHREPSTYTPSGARPGQQNPVNPQGSPGANPLDPAVGARPLEPQISVEPGRDGDYTKVVTEGEKNASQRPYEIDHQPDHNDY